MLNTVEWPKIYYSNVITMIVNNNQVTDLNRDLLWKSKFILDTCSVQRKKRKDYNEHKQLQTPMEL